MIKAVIFDCDGVLVDSVGLAGEVLAAYLRELGFAVTDRVRVSLPRSYAELVEQHGDWIAREVLAVGIEVGDVDEPELTKA